VDAALIINLIATLTLLAGLGFAVVQIRQFRIAREREITLELLRSYQTPEFAAAFHLVLSLPNGLTAEEIERQLDGKMGLVYVLLTTLESLGVLVFRREVSLDLVDDYFSGLIHITWNKLAPYIEHLRAKESRDTLGEWVQWLHDRMQEREHKIAPVPAHVAHRAWTPT
jgi:hypothetical protein